jgi:hypothetical protein
VKAGVIVGLALLWRLLAWIWSILIIGIIVGVIDRPDDLDQFVNFHRRQLSDAVTIDLATEHRLAESRAFTEGTWPVSHVGRYRFLRALGHGFHVARDVLVVELIDNA